MNEYLLAVYLWGSLALIGAALPVGIVAFRGVVGACQRLFSDSDPVRKTPSLPSVPLPSYPSSPG